MIQPWRVLESKPLGDFRVFKIRGDTKVSPRTGERHDFVVLEARNWVNVIALTPHRELVMVEQFRHGSGTVELEIPGGVMDPHDASPVAAGVGELREETGYAGGVSSLLGQVWSNPAIMSNTCFTVLIEDCVRRHELKLDRGEDLVTRLVPAAELPALVAAGQFPHSLVVAALYDFELHQRGLPGLQA